MQGDALDLSMLSGDTFDLTLVFGPSYHLYEPEDQHSAIDEAIRVTKPGGIIIIAVLSVYAILFTNYLYEGLKGGLEENFTAVSRKLVSPLIEFEDKIRTNALSILTERKRCASIQDRNAYIRQSI